MYPLNAFIPFDSIHSTRLNVLMLAVIISFLNSTHFLSLVACHVLQIEYNVLDQRFLDENYDVSIGDCRRIYIYSR